MGTPTGTVFNSDITAFIVSKKGISGASLFLFDTEDGTISGWSLGVDMTHAILAVDNSSSGAVYKGLALGTNRSGIFLYATNFHAGTIDVFNKKFAPARLSGSFTDPSLPQGYAPFGINNINGKLYVTYTKQNAQKNCRLTHKFAKTGRYASEEENGEDMCQIQVPISFREFKKIVWERAIRNSAS